MDALKGVFSHQHNPDGRPLGLIAGGIGITPTLSMLRTLRATDPEHQVTFLWGGQPTG